MEHRGIAGSRKNPMWHRISLVWLAASVALGSGLAHAETITERDVIRAARSRDPSVHAAAEAASVAEAEVVRAGLYPNPSLGWDREHLPGHEREDTFAIAVPIELAGARPARKGLARAAVTNARARALRARSDATVQALTTFYDALAQEREVELVAASLGALEEIARIVARRHAEGTISGYDRTRVELEVELVRSEREELKGSARAARAHLASLFGVDAAGLELRGDFTTAPPAQRPGPAPKSLALLRRSEVEARGATDAAGWAWLPDLTLSGGFRIREAESVERGYVAGVALSLPIFSSGQDVRAESAAQARLAGAERTAAERSRRAEEASALAVLTAARAELARFSDATRARRELLSRAVQSGYEAGERSIVELLDAERTRLAIERRRLALEVAAKRAEIRLRAARGEFE